MIKGKIIRFIKDFIYKFLSKICNHYFVAGYCQWCGAKDWDFDDGSIRMCSYFNLKIFKSIKEGISPASSKLGTVHISIKPRNVFDRKKIENAIGRFAEELDGMVKR